MTTPPPQPDYATPRKDESDVDLDAGNRNDDGTYKPMTQEERDAALEIALKTTINIHT